MRVWVLMLLVPALAGCSYCGGESVDATVTLTARSVEVRTLPILASGGTEVAGVEVPDSHARMTYGVRMDGGPSYVDVRDLRLSVRVDGEDVPAVLHRVESGGAWDRHGERWSGRLDDGATLTLWWGIDWQEAGPRAAVLAEGAAVDVDLSFDWSMDDCVISARGETRHHEATVAAASLVTTTFESTGTPTIDPDGITGATFQADLRVKNGVTTTVGDGRALAVLLPEGAATPGLAAWPDVATYDGLLPKTTFGPGETVTVREQTPAPWTGASDGLAILVLHLHHDPDGPGTDDDVLAWAVEV